jgi:hypothetical protein
VLKDVGNWLGENSNRQKENRSWTQKWQDIVDDDKETEKLKAEEAEANREIEV